MELGFIVFGILALVCFFEARHLSKNTIPKDEDVYYILCVVCLMLMLGIAIYDPKDIMKLF